MHAESTAAVIRIVKSAVATALVCSLVTAAHAADVAGVSFADTVQSDSTALTDNGSGLRSKVFGLFKIYAIALYLPRKETTADAVIAGRGPKRLAIVFLRERTAPQFVGEIEDGVAANRGNAAPAALRDRLGQFSKRLAANGPFAKGTTVWFDWLPESGTRLSIDGRVLGAAIPGKDFYDALLAIWLGRRPVQEDLKKALLGKGG